MSELIVVGSSNTDMVIKANRIPKPGETILGGDFFMNQGGKGANQAVAASRLGARVAFVSKLGKDIFGNQAIESLEKENINTSYVAVSQSMPSGIANIILGESGENSIVVAPGANYDLNKEDVDKAFTDLREAKMVLLQLEIPLEIAEYVISLGSSMGKKIILNPAPAHDLSDKIFSSLFAITPNETEAELLTGIKVIDEESAHKAALQLKNKGVENVVITMGSKGAYLYTNAVQKLLETSKVKAVDTTGAGDTFNGAFASALLKGMDIQQSVCFANKAAAIAVTRLGAQTGIPYQSEMEALENLG